MVSKKGIIEKLSLSGYPLELYIKDILLNDGWLVWPNQYYLDKDENGKPREYDIKAEKQIFLRKSDSSLNIVLLIQCKKVPGNTWVFFSGPETRAINHSFSSFPITISLLDTMKIQSTEALSVIIRPLLDKKTHYDYGYFSSGYSELIMNPKESNKSTTNLWDSEVTLIKVVDSVRSDCLSSESIRYSIEDLEDQGPDKWFDSGAGQSIFMLFPVIVFEGDMCSVKFPLIEKNVNEENYVKLYRNMKSGQYTFRGTIDVVNNSFFENYLKRLNNDFKTIKKTMDANWSNFLLKEKELVTFNEKR